MGEAMATETVVSRIDGVRAVDAMVAGEKKYFSHVNELFCSLSSCCGGYRNMAPLIECRWH